MALRLLLVDDSATFAAAAAAALAHDGFEVIGVAADGRQALELAAAVRPDVVVIDIGLPDISGFEVATRLSAESVAPEVVLISTHRYRSSDPRITRCRARGFLPKEQLDGDAVRRLLREPA